MPIIGLVLALTFWASTQVANLEIEVSSDALLSKDSGLIREYEIIRSQFGSDQVVGIYIRDDSLFAPETLRSLAELNRKLNRMGKIQRVESLFSVPSIHRSEIGLETGPLLKQDAIPDDQTYLDSRRAMALENPLFVRRVISRDGNATMITLFIKERESEALTQGQYFSHLHQEVEQVLEEHVDDFDALFQVGSPAVQHSIAQFIVDDQKVLLPIAAVLLVVLIGISMQSIPGAIIPILNAVLASSLVLGLMAGLGVPLNMLNSIVPAMLLIIGATEDVHFLSEYRDAINEGLDRRQAVKQTGVKIGLTLVLTGITTTLGFASTAVADLDILREFGITAGLAMFIRLLLSIAFLPALLRFIRIKPSRKPGGKQRATRGLQRYSDSYASFALNTLLDHKVMIIGIMAVITIPSLFLGRTIHVGNDLTGFLQDRSPIIQHLNQAGRELSGSKVIFLTIHNEPGSFKEPANLHMLAAIRNRLEESGRFDSVTALSDHISLLNQEFKSGEAADFQIPDDPALIAQYLLFLSPGSLQPYVSGDFGKANIVLRSSIDDSREFSQVYQQIRYRLGTGEFGDLNFSLTGKSILVAEAVDEIVKSQVASLGVVIVMLLLIVATLFVSWRASLLAVLANLFPVVILFGVMGLLKIPLNVGTCMVAAITVGIAVDDTLHLMVRYNRELKSTKDELKALHSALAAEFQPVMTTSLGLAIGFLVLSFSSFIPIRQFGLLSAMVIMLAVVADLILTPVLLSTTRLITIWDMIGLKVRNALLERSPLFEGMKPWQAKKLILTATIQEYQRGDYIIHQGEEGSTMYVVIDGKLSVERGKGQTRSHLAVLTVGDALGEVALVSKSKRTADVIAKTHTKVLALDWDSLLSLQRFAPYLSSRLFLNLSRIMGDRMVSSLGQLDTAAPFLPKSEESLGRGQKNVEE